MYNYKEAWKKLSVSMLYNIAELDKQYALFDLILYVPSTIFQLNRDGSSWVEPVLSYDKCALLKDHNTVTPVRFKPAASRSRVKHSTTEPLGSLQCHHILNPFKSNETSHFYQMDQSIFVFRVVGCCFSFLFKFY